MVSNPEKFQMIFLGPHTQNKLTELELNGLKLKNCEKVRLLGVTIDNKLTFSSHISEICATANNKLRALIRIRNFIDEKQCLYLINAYVTSYFQYCNAIWMFCNKKDNNKIETIHKRSLRCIYNDQNKSYEELLKINDTPTIHVKNLQSLMVIIYQTLNNQNPNFMKIFSMKRLLITISDQTVY